MKGFEMNITAGDWIYWNPDEWTHCIVTAHGELPNGESNTWPVMSMNSRREDADANARFVIDAQKAFRETGKTPRQLAEENSKLRAALKTIQEDTRECSIAWECQEALKD